MEYKDINDYEVLYLVEENQSEYKEIIIKKYSPIVKKITYNFYIKLKKYGVEYEDVYQEALIGLNYAIDHFDFNRNNKFYTYALLCVRSKLNTLFKRLNNDHHKALNNSMLFNQMNDTDIEALISVNFDDTYISFYNRVLKFKNSLDGIQAPIFELKYNGFSNRDIGMLLGLNVKKVYQQVCLIRKKLLISGF